MWMQESRNVKTNNYRCPCVRERWVNGICGTGTGGWSVVLAMTHKHKGVKEIVRKVQGKRGKEKISRDKTTSRLHLRRTTSGVI